MSEPRFTPGPWRLTLASNDAGRFTVRGDSRAEHGDDMVVTQRLIGTVDGEEGIANAHLIAAAPDLYEAAKHAAMEWRLHGQLTDSCRVLERALAKAEGRAQEDRG